MSGEDQGVEMPAAADDVENTKQKDSEEEEVEEKHALPPDASLEKTKSLPVFDSFVLRPGARLRMDSNDADDHLQRLMKQRQASLDYIHENLGHKKKQDEEAKIGAMLDSSAKKTLDTKIEVLREIERWHAELLGKRTLSQVQVRMNKLSYKVQIDPEASKIQTVQTANPFYKFRKWLRTRNDPNRNQKVTKHVLQDISLVLHPGKMYLVLGPPASGKTTLLKAIAGRLSLQNEASVQGSVEYNGLKLEDENLLKSLFKEKEICLQNAIAYIEQLDRHAPRMTVKETFRFAFQCLSGGNHAFGDTNLMAEDPDLVKKMDDMEALTMLTLKFLGLEHVADTFVGNADVRGVSGGQRRRVTVGEMMQGPSQVLCGDEISTGLDAASTFDIVFIMSHIAKLIRRTRIISLLQPSPETVSCFDDVILLAEGRLLYAGPIDKVESYFASLGYRAPSTMDVADFLQLLSTPDGAELFEPNEQRTKPYTLAELADCFPSSQYGQFIQNELKQPWNHKWERKSSVTDSDDKKKNTEDKLGVVPERLERRYLNSWGRSMWLNLSRNILIWTRDRRFLIANFVKNVIMGISVGGVFFQTEDSTSILGVLFQSMLFIMLGAMTAAPAQVADRIIYYRQRDAMFYPPFPYVIGKAISLIPQALLDVFTFGSIIYFMVGLAPGADHFLTFIAVLFVFTLVMNQGLSIFAAIAPNASTVQGLGACVLLFNVVFCGFILFPNIIPNYYIWIYWFVPLAWAYRALLVNEFHSDKWGDAGPLILKANGFTLGGESFGPEWVGYGFAYLIPLFVVFVLLTGWGLIAVRADGESKGGGTEVETQDDDDNDKKEEAPTETVEIPFTPVTLTFDDICYDVKSSTGNDTIRLLNNASGVFQAGHMCALMGTSGAGKTTLMDCIALRKNSGEITGEVKLNGFLQQALTFRRCTGYVEQFDVQTATLTVRESCLFSARLRLDSSNPDIASDEAKQQFVDQVLDTLELSALADVAVGNDEEGGLSFEQRKRLSIAVELAASPSIIFLDEPTSGLDARAALLVAKALRRIADSGRTVIATIHQPSSSVFELFDDLLLLKKGGRVVFHGPLGPGCSNLIQYFQEKGGGGDDSKISQGENPANWMLKVLGSGINANDQDFAALYKKSKEGESIRQLIQQTNASPDPKLEITFATEFAADSKTRSLLLNGRLQTIYWRSPSYNLVRLLISAFIGFLLGAAFVTNRNPPVSTETEITSVLATMFISFIITGVLSILSVLPVMLEIRDVFYRHEQAGMISYTSLAAALSVAEQWFIALMGFSFCIIFIPAAGAHGEFGSATAFWGFFTLNLAIYSYFGQAFMCLVKGMATAQILASVFIGLNNFFSGYIVRPQFMEGLFAFTFWITPGHYVYEGMVLSVFTGDNRTVTASEGSDFYESLGCTPALNATTGCEGTVEDFVDNFFGGEFPLGQNRTVFDALVLVLFMFLARGATFLALKHFRYTST